MLAAGDSVKVVVLNACFTAVQAQAIVGCVPCVVGMSGTIGDHAARLYAEHFYSALACGSSVKSAYLSGRAALTLDATDRATRDVQRRDEAYDEQGPQLLTRVGTDADAVRIVQLPESRMAAEAQQGSVVYTLIIDAKFHECDEQVIGRLTAELCRLCKDLSIKIIRVEEGSVRLTISLSRAAAQRLTELRTSGELKQICGFHVERVFKSRAELKQSITVGAGRVAIIGASTTIATPGAPPTTVSTLADAEATARRPPVEHQDDIEDVKNALIRHHAQYYPHLHRVALRLSGNTDIANDLVQTTWYRALDKFEHFRQDTDLKTWLVRIMTNQFLDSWKHQRLVRRAEPELALMHYDPGDAGPLVRESQHAQLDAALCALEPELRVVVELCYLKGLRYHEASRLLGVPISTIGTRLKRARDRLRELLAVEQ
jgi:RNA polymerase sigma-70 factor (ECF subfamily)